MIHQQLKKKITREKFIDMCQEYYNQYKFNWTVENGISPRCVNSICEKYEMEQCFLEGDLKDKKQDKAILCHLACIGGKI